MDGYDDVTGAIAETLRELGIRSAIGVPVSVAGRTWGVMTATSKGAEPLPAAIESRLRAFTELLATAIANAEARAEVARLAQEQAALRRVATLVAQGGAPAEVFASVTGEATELLDASAVTLARYEDEQLLVIAQRGRQTHVQVGERYPLGGTNVASIVLRTGRTARLDDIATASGRIGDVARGAGVRSVVAAPVTVDGRTWGVLVAIWTDRPSPPSEPRSGWRASRSCSAPRSPTPTAATQLTASRARVLAAGDDARRRVVRDLHDGAQQRLVHTIVTLKLAQRALQRGRRATRRRCSPRRSAPRSRRWSRCASSRTGCCPRCSPEAGCAPAWTRSCRGSTSPSTPRRRGRAGGAGHRGQRVLHRRRRAHERRQARAGDGGRPCGRRSTAGSCSSRSATTGSAAPIPSGHGLVGLADRVAALGGELRIESPQREGTRLAARLPL